MNGETKVEKVLEKITDLGLWVASISLFVMMWLVFVSVIFRYLLGNSIPWSVELSQFLLMWMVYLGTAAVSLKRDHIKADILGQALSQRGKAIRDVIGEVITVILLSAMLVRMVPYTVDLAGTFKVSPALEMPQWVMFTSFVVGFSLLWVTHLWNVVQGMWGLARKRVNRTREE